MNDTLTLLQAAVRKRAGSQHAITPVAEDLCRIIDHHVSLWQYDRNRYDERIKALETKLGKASV